MMVAAGAADRAPAECLVHDLADRAGATSALGAAAEATIDLASGLRLDGTGHCGADLPIAQHVAGTDNHRRRRPPGAQGSAKRVALRLAKENLHSSRYSKL